MPLSVISLAAPPLNMDAFYYPFHLCHQRTLHRMLQDYSRVHFRDFMALQLTPMMGMTAFTDRMGDAFPDLLKAGRILQGHKVSGPLSPAMVVAVNRDLEDDGWRLIFHQALTSDDRFQRGLFRPRMDQQGKDHQMFDIEDILLVLTKPELALATFTVESLQVMSRKQRHQVSDAAFDYGMAILATSASLQYTIQLCHQHNLVAVTDSPSHNELLFRICEREKMSFSNRCLSRKGY